MIEYTRDMWALASEGEKQGVLFFIAVYMLVMCSYSLFRQILIKPWPTAIGLLESASLQISLAL